MSRPSSLSRRSSSVGPTGSRPSRLPTRDGFQANRGKTIHRAGLEKRSIDRNFARSKSTLGEPLLLSRQRSGSLLRGGTPSSQSGRSSQLSFGKSPASVQKDNRPINDKKWQYEQLVKVRTFIAQNDVYIDHNMVKPGMSTDMFIALTGALFRMIDKRIIITRENYVDEVPTRLRMFKYPATVKPSLMKAVNVPHSWSSVIAILAWLTDIVIKTTRPIENPLTNTLHNMALKCFIDGYNLWNMGEENTTELKKPIQELDKNAGEYFGNDIEKLREMEERCRTLEVSVSQYSELNKKKQAENLALREKCETLQNKCQHFSHTRKEFEKEMTEKKLIVCKKTEKLDEEIESLLMTEKNLKDIINTQQFSAADQKRLMSEIEELKHVIQLEEERCQQQKAHVHAFDHQLSDFNQKIQTAAYKYNNLISEMEIINPLFKELHIRESGFLRSDTKESLDAIIDKLALCQSELTEDLKTKRNILESLRRKEKTLEEELIASKRELDECVRTHAELELTTKHRNAKFASEKQIAVDKLNKARAELSELQSKRLDIAVLEQKLLQIQSECDLIEKQNSELKYNALSFFTKLHLQICNDHLNYLKVMENISRSVQETQEKIIEGEEACIEHFEKVGQEIKAMKSDKK